MWTVITGGQQVKVDEMRRVPFGKAAAAWLEMRKPEIATKTYREYTNNIETLGRWFGEKKLPAITEDDVKDFQDERRQEKYRGNPITANTINKECNVLCQMRSYIGQPFPKGSYKPLKKKKSKIGQTLSDEQRTHLLHMAKVIAESDPASCGIYLYTKLALNTGAGPKEIAGITLGDIDLSEQQVHIRGTKTEGRDRMQPLNAEAMEAVIEAIHRAKKLGSTGPDHYLFPFLIQSSKKYDPTKPQVSFRRAWESLRESAGLPTFRMYDMRHDFITRLLSDPHNSEEVVEEMVGHLTSAQKKQYSHQRLDRKRVAVDRMLLRKVGKYTKKPAHSAELDDGLAQQIALVVSATLAQMQQQK